MCGISHFPLLGGASSILRIYRVGPVKNTLYKHIVCFDYLGHQELKNVAYDGLWEPYEWDGWDGSYPLGCYDYYRAPVVRMKKQDKRAITPPYPHVKIPEPALSTPSPDFNSKRSNVILLLCDDQASLWMSSKLKANVKSLTHFEH